MHPGLVRRPLALAVTSLLALPAAAQTATELKDVVVSATRQEAAADAVPVTVTTVNAAQIELRLPRDLTELFAADPDLAVARNRARFGSATVNIRGIEGNRVLSLVDGVRLPDYYNGGGPSNMLVANQAGPEAAFLKRVEVVRGPASSLYGSDALGGVVAYLTKGPEDFLKDGRNQAFQYTGAWRGEDKSWSHTGAFAVGGAAAQFLLMANRSDGHELANRGDVDSVATDRSKPNPQDTRSSGVLAKLALQPAAGHRLSLAVDRREIDVATEVKRLSSSLPRVTWAEGDDNSRRTRTSLDWDWKPAGAWVDRLRTQLYHQESESRTGTDSRRSNTSATCSASAAGSNQCELRQDFGFDQTQSGLSVQADKLIQSGGVSHLLALGADWSRSKVAEMRDTTAWNRTTGSVYKTLAGENFPLSDFPAGRTDSLGAFFQDEIAIGALSLTPGLRYDKVELKPDSLAAPNPALPSASGRSHSAVSPKLGLVWQADPATALYGQVMKGFRAPNYSEANGSFLNTVQRYGIAPNPELKPETSVGLEIGARWHAGPARASLAIHDTRYKDFISQVSFPCPASPQCIAGTVTTFQNVNLAKVRITGLELRGGYELGGGHALQATLAHAKGDDEQAGQPLNSIEPTRLSLAWLWDKGSHGGEARLNAAAAKKRVNENLGGSAQFLRPGSWQVVDLAAWWKPSKHTRLTAAVNNLFDRKYFLWSDIRHAAVAASDPGTDFYTQPGRQLSLSFQADF